MILAEEKFGITYRHQLHYKWRRFLRGLKGKKVVKSGTPFNWSVGITGRPMYDIKNQYQSDSCFGQAYSRALQIILGGADLSAKSIYSQCFAPGGGVDIGDAENEATILGATLESNVPSTTMGDCTEPFVESITWETPTLVQDCLTRAGFELLNVDIDINSIADAIQQYKGVIMIIQGQNGNPPGWLAPIPTPPQSSNSNPLWQHFLSFTGNIPPQTANFTIPFYNSWGYEVGTQGIQELSETYINSGHVLDVFVVTPFQFTNDMWLGCSGTNVWALQYVLQSTGDFTGTPTGFFGTQTLSAVLSFQKRNGILPLAGYCGSITRSKLPQLRSVLSAK